MLRVTAALLMLTQLISAVSDAATAQTQKIGAWQYMTLTDPMSDTKRYVALLTGTGGMQFAIKCDAPAPSSVYLGLSSTNYLGKTTEGPRSLQYRFDEEPAISERWYYEETTAYDTDRASVAQFITLAKGKRRLRIEASRFDYAPVDGEFVLDSNTASVFARLLSDCKN